MRNVDLVKRGINPDLRISTIVPVMSTLGLARRRMVAEVRQHFGELVTRTIIPRSVRLSEAPSYGQPILSFDPLSRGAIAYRDLAKEVHHVAS